MRVDTKPIRFIAFIPPRGYLPLQNVVAFRNVGVFCFLVNGHDDANYSHAGIKSGTASFNMRYSLFRSSIFIRIIEPCLFGAQGPQRYVVSDHKLGKRGMGTLDGCIFRMKRLMGLNDEDSGRIS